MQEPLKPEFTGKMRWGPAALRAGDSKPGRAARGRHYASGDTWVQLAAFEPEPHRGPPSRATDRDRATSLRRSSQWDGQFSVYWWPPIRAARRGRAPARRGRVPASESSHAASAGAAPSPAHVVAYTPARQTSVLRGTADMAR